MSVNTMTFEQAATLMNAIHQQVTGDTSITATDVSSFITVAQKTLQAGYDPVINAISQVIGKTIFSIRPYTAKFGGLQMDTQKWGAITRKLAVSDKPFEDSEVFNLVDGQSIDMWEINKPNVVQFNFYGAQQFAKRITIFTSQLDNAFRGVNEFSEFMSMILQNVADMIEQAKESMARMALGNFIAGKITVSNGVIHLLTEYNAETGLSLTSTTVKDPANFPAFIKWAYARISTLTSLMTERSLEYQVQVTGNELVRHTPFERQKVYLYNWLLNNIDARVLADTYNYKFLQLSDVEAVNYWQAIEDPDEINILPTYLKTDGTLDSPGSAVSQSDIMGVIFDDEAMGITVMDEFVGVSPLNTRGKYFNYDYSFLIRYFNDFTEKGLVLLLD